MNKQIEEMAKVLEFCCNGENIENCNSDRSCDSCRAKYLYNAGYRKIPENAVVLTEEEYKRLQRRQENCKTCVEIATEMVKKARKETVDKFAERLKDALFDLGNVVTEKDIDEIAKELGWQ